MKFFNNKFIQLFLLIFCLWIFYHTGAQTGWNVIYDGLKKVSGIGVFCILMYPFLGRLCQSYTYYLLADIPNSRFYDFVAAQIGSLFVMDMLPFGGTGGETFRVFYLKICYPQSLNRLVGGIILYNLIYFFSFLFLIITTIIVCVIYFPLSLGFKILICSCIVFPILIFLVFLNVGKKGFLDKILLLLSWIKGLKPIIEKLRTKVIQIDLVVSDFFYQQPKKFFIVLGILIFVKILGVLEILVITYFIGHFFNFPQALFLTFVDQMVQSFLFFLPGGQIGVLEHAVNQMGVMIAIPLVFVAILSIWKRIRTLFWDFLGLIFILLKRKKLFVTQDHVANNQRNFYE